jgi:zinc transporter 9
LNFPSIEAVSHVQSQWIGPTAFAYKAEVDFDGTYLSAKLQSSYRKLFVEAATKGDLAHELPILLS